MMNRLLPAILFAVCAAAAYPHGEGADHSHEAPELGAAPPMVGDGTSVSGHGNAFDMTITHAPFHPNERVELQIYLADWESNAPVDGARIELTMTGPEFKQVITPEPADEVGEYRASVSVPSDASYSFLADVTVGDRNDLFSLTGFRSESHEAAVAGGGNGIGLGQFNVYLALGAAVVFGLGGLALGLRLGGKRRRIAQAGNDWEAAK